MRWNSNFAAIRFVSGEESSVHIVERRHIESESRSSRYTDTKTFCEVSLVTAYEECSETDINCETCVTNLEHYQATWREFWLGPKGEWLIKKLLGIDKLEEKRREEQRASEERDRKFYELCSALLDCFQHTQPVFTLELPDEILLKLMRMEYNSVGHLLADFKVREENRQKLQTELGKEGFALVGSRLVTRGLLKSDDPIFSKVWS